MNNKELLDALTAMQKCMSDGFAALNKSKATDGECSCGGKKTHSDNCPMYAERAEDDDVNFGERNQEPTSSLLIPNNSNGSGEGNTNPTARDCEAALNNLRGIRHVIASSGDRRAIDAYNAAVVDIKRKLADALMHPERVGPDQPRQAMDNQRDMSADYEAQCAALHRENIKPSMSNEELSELSKKRRAKDAPRRVGDSQREVCEDFEDTVKVARDKALAKK